MVFDKALRTLALVAASALAATSASASATSWRPEGPAAPSFASASPSAEARHAWHWVIGRADHQGKPFAIVDKKDARLFVFDAAGRLLGATPALLGLAPGDHAVPGVGQKKLADILPFERTTPAGRFASEPGRNLNGEAVVWVDYDAGLAIHRLRPVAASERRPQRLASATPADNRISLGCVIVSVDFYLQVVQPTLGSQPGVVYVLPESLPVEAMLDAGSVDGTASTAS
jgi:hypothetical protein